MGAFASGLAALRPTQPRSPLEAVPSTYPTSEGGGEGLFGFLGNLAGDVGDLVGGLYQFVGTGVSELVTQPTNVAKEFATLGFADTPVNVLTPAVIPHLGQALVDDVKDRYLDGDIGKELYENPLSFLLDVTAVAGAAGGVARAATGTGRIYGNLGKFVAPSRVARNSELLQQARALRVAQTSEDAAKVAEITAALGPNARKAKMLDALVTQPFAIADPLSGTTFDVLPTRNPLISAVFSEPVRRKYLMEGVSNFRGRVDDLRRVVNEGADDPATLRKLAQMESALGRMEASGAQYVAGKSYGTVLARSKMKHATDSLLGKMQMRGIIDRRAQREALRVIMRHANASPENLPRILNMVEALDDGTPTVMDPAELLAQVSAKGFPTLEDAADAVWRHDPAANALDVDEQMSLQTLALTGQIDPLARFRQQVDETITGLTGESEDAMPVADEAGDVMSAAAIQDRRIARLNELFQRAEAQGLSGALTDLGNGVVRFERPGGNRVIYLALEDVEVPVEVPTPKDWYRHQNEQLEAIPKEMEGRERGFGMEAAMDIGRELSLKPDRWAGDYIREKLDRVRSVLDENRLEPLEGKDAQLAEQFRAAGWGPTDDARIQQVQQLVEALLEGDVPRARQLLDDLEYILREVREGAEDYRFSHRPNEGGPRAFDLYENGDMPDDMYDRPELYVGDPDSPAAQETIAALRAIRDKPDAEVTVYRAAPEGSTLNEGDWVTLSKTYATQHGFHADDPDLDLPVMEQKVRARDIRFAGDDLNEFGYWPERVPQPTEAELRARYEGESQWSFPEPEELRAMPVIGKMKGWEFREHQGQWIATPAGAPSGGGLFRVAAPEGPWGKMPAGLRKKFEAREKVAPAPAAPEAPPARAVEEADPLLEGVDRLLVSHRTWPNSKGVIEETWTDKADLVRRLKEDLGAGMAGSGGAGGRFVQADARGIRFIGTDERYTWSKVADALIRRRKLRGLVEAEAEAPAARVSPETPPAPEMRIVREVVGYRDTTSSFESRPEAGHVIHTATRTDRRRRGIGERLHRAHWADQDITTPEKILAALEMNTFTPESAGLNRKVANDFADTFQATYHDALAAMDLRPRRTRTIEQVQDLTGRYPDGRQVQQTIRDPDNLARMAVEAVDPMSQALGAIFGKNVRLRLKDVDKIRSATKEGARVLDALGARVLIDNWQGVPRAIEAMEGAGLEILGVDDLRRTPGQGGMRGSRVYVRNPDPANPITVEVEVGTPLYDRFRDSTYAHDSKTNEIHRDLRMAEQELQRVASSTNANQAGVQQSIEEHQRLVDELKVEQEAADRYMEGIYEMLTDEIAAHHGRAIPDAEVRGIVNELRLWVSRYLETDLILDKAWDWNFAYAFERLYLPARIKSGAQWSEEEDMFLGGESAYDLDGARAAAGLPMPVYFPHIESPGDIRDFTTPMKARQGQKKMAEDKHRRRSRGYLFEQGSYITDIEDAYSRRAARAIKMRDTYEFIANVSKKFGRKIESVDDLVEGEAVIAPEFLQAFVRLAIGIEDRLGKLVSEMSDTDLLRAVENLNPKLAREMAPDIIAEGLRGALGVEEREAGALFLSVAEAMQRSNRRILAVSKKGLELYAVPKIVAQRIDESARWNLGSGARVFWDKPTQLWRALTLYGRPAWVVNNILGNVTFSKIGGVRIREIVKTAIDREYRWYVNELANVYGQGDVAQGWLSSSDFFTPNLGIAEETLSGRAMAKLEAKGRSSRMLKPFRRYADGIKGVNTAIENLFRKVGFVEGLRQVDVKRNVHGATRGFWGSKEELQRMLADGFTDKQAVEALDKMQVWFGDYASMSPIERQVLRRFIFPFWGFYRHMGKLLVKLPFDHPGKTKVMYGMALVSQDLREEYGPVPEWMDGMVPFGPMSPDGMQKFLSVAGPNPFNAFMDVGLGLFHPAIKATVEMMTGRDAYTGREFSDPDVFTPFGSTTRYRIVRGPDGVPIDAIPVEKVAPSLPVELLSQIPQYDMLRSLLAGGRPYDTSGLVESATQGGMTDSEGNPIGPYSAGSALARLGGASFYDYDVGAFRERQAQERENALTQAYERWAEERAGSPVGVG